MQSRSRRSQYGSQKARQPEPAVKQVSANAIIPSIFFRMARFPPELARSRWDITGISKTVKFNSSCHFLRPTEPQVDQLDHHGEGHCEINVTLVEMLAEGLRNEQDADQDQEGEG